MPLRLPDLAVKWTSIFLVGAALLTLLVVTLYRKHQKAYYTVGIILNSVEVNQADMEVVRHIIDKKVESINKEGGINGRPVRTILLDDKGDPNLLYKLVAETIKDPNLIGYVGCKSSTRARKIAPLLVRENVPLLGGYSLTPLMARYPNMYSGEIGIKEVSDILQELFRSKGSKGGFIGRTGDLYSAALLNEMDKLAAADPKFKVTFRRWFPLNHQFTEAELNLLADSLKQKSDFLLLSTEQAANNLVLEALWKRGMRMPVFCGLADISQLDAKSPNYRVGELYDLNAFGIPGVLNMRFEEQVAKYRESLQAGNLREFLLGFGGRHADQIGLLKEASLDRSLPPTANIRDRIAVGLQKFVRGNRIYKGWFDDWYFTPERAFGGEPLLAWKPRDFAVPMLAPIQYVRTDSGLQKTPVLYANLDVVEISQVKDEEGSFFTTFYLELNSVRNLTIKDVDFSNAARNKISHEPLVETRLIRSKSDSAGLGYYNYLYKISGKFLFDPELRRYPFDEQKFPITLQAANSLKNFMVQPPDVDLRDTAFEATGWTYKKNYVGFDHDIITSDNNFTTLVKNIPYYKFSFVYVLKRARVDFTLKSLVPLLAILIISYFSVYIPLKQFEALAGIQVTGLLAAIALYFSTYKPEMQNATVSDQIFIFTYIMVTSLVGSSILIYVMHQKNKTLHALACIYQRYIFPFVVVGFTVYIQL